MALPYVPTVDFAPYAIDIRDDQIDRDLAASVDSALVTACATVGFVYLKNHGVTDEQVQRAVNVANEFFALPVEVKSKCARPDVSNHGWVGLERESLNPKRPGDMKESFNITTFPDESRSWPEYPPHFRSTVEDLSATCETLAWRVLTSLSRGLGLKDENYFRANHQFREAPHATALRIVTYPPLTKELKDGQIRCGEHSDYGSITLLFQDDVGGLEVMNRQGNWVAATPIPGTVLVNIGDLMQRWTSDKLVSTKHRVLVPDNESQKLKSRTSVAFFVHPGDDCLIESLDGSHKYDPIRALDYLNMRFDDSYKVKK